MIFAMSAMSVPVGPHGSLEVAIASISMVLPPRDRRKRSWLHDNLPLRTLTWTVEYPFVTFFTLLMTDDIFADYAVCRSSSLCSASSDSVSLNDMHHFTHVSWSAAE